MDDNTIEALREVLQDMSTAIELLLSGDRSGAALIHFIEQMLKTIESWAAKYNVVLDDGSLISMSAQGSQPENHYQMFPFPSLPSQDVTGTPRNAVESLSHHNLIEEEAIQQCRGSPNQENPTLNPGSAGDILEHAQIDGTVNDGWQATGNNHSSGVTSSTERRKTRSQLCSTHIDAMSKDDGKTQICSPQSSDCLNSSETGLGKESSESKGDRIGSPSWLPEGWIVEVKTGGIGNNVSSKNKVYVDPTSSHRFQSKKEVFAFLGMPKQKRGRPRKTESSKDGLPGHGNDTVLAAVVCEPVKSSNSEVQLLSDPSFSHTMPSKGKVAVSPGVHTTKRKRGRPRKSDTLNNVSQTDLPADHLNASVQACDLPESIEGANMEAPSSTSAPEHDLQQQAAVSTIPSSMNIVPLPHQSAQPSEWHVYESLASLPFPMFEHLRFMENNANKLVTNSSPPTLWPWMLSNSEVVKKPSIDIKVRDSKPVEESKQGEAEPMSFVEEAHAGETVPKRPKKAARKNAS